MLVTLSDSGRWDMGEVPAERDNRGGCRAWVLRGRTAGGFLEELVSVQRHGWQVLEEVARCIRPESVPRMGGALAGKRGGCGGEAEGLPALFSGWHQTWSANLASARLMLGGSRRCWLAPQPRSSAPHSKGRVSRAATAPWGPICLA